MIPATFVECYVTFSGHIIGQLKTPRHSSADSRWAVMLISGWVATKHWPFSWSIKQVALHYAICKLRSMTFFSFQTNHKPGMCDVYLEMPFCQSLDLWNNWKSANGVRFFHVIGRADCSPIRAICNHDRTTSYCNIWWKLKFVARNHGRFQHVIQAEDGFYLGNNLFPKD